MECWWADTDRGEQVITLIKKNLFQCHFVNNKSDADWQQEPNVSLGYDRPSTSSQRQNKAKADPMCLIFILFKNKYFEL